MYIYIYIYIHRNIHTYIHTYIHIHTYIIHISKLFLLKVYLMQVKKVTVTDLTFWYCLMVSVFVESCFHRCMHVLSKTYI